jgi:hypothetical protein
LSPILVRPVREQLEHDRVIRLLQAKYKRKFEVAINPGNEQVMPVGAPPSPWYPDLVLQSQERGHKLLGVVEVETAESVNHLEAMSQWAALARLRAAFHLYVPSGSVDNARRLCNDLQIPVDEFWAYNWLGDQMRFTLVQRSAAAEAKARSAAKAAVNGAARVAAKAPAKAARRKPAAKPRVAAPLRGRAAAAKSTARPRAAKKTAAKAQKRK